jgi:hypothetical protein
MDLSKIDTNFAVKDHLDLEDVSWFDVRKEPFCLYGFYHGQEEKTFCRLPRAVAEATSIGVLELYANTAGGRVRFRTDSPYIAIRAEYPSILRMAHMPLTGSAGFDLYRVRDGYQTYINSFVPPSDLVQSYESVIPLDGGSMEEYLINFPLYNNVDSLFVGVKEGSKLLEGGKYRNEKPVVFYGSSITQGGCASRPGNCYQNFISRDLNLDYINLGFSGSGRAEDAIVDYMAQMEMSAFVCDYDYNAPDPEYLDRTHRKMYQKIRAKQPELPYIMVSKPNPERNPKDSLKRRQVVFETFQYAIAQGDQNAYYLDGQALFGGQDRDACTVDSTHPNDLGFYRMADVIGAVLRKLW